MKKQATYGDYIITINDDSSVSVTYQNEECNNAKKALREVSEQSGFAFDAGWTTRQFGSKLVDFLQSKGGAIEKKEDTANKVTSKRNHVVVTLDIVEHEYMAFDSDGDMAGCESHCFNGDEGFRNLQVIVDDVPLDEGVLEDFNDEYSEYETFNLEWDEEVTSVGYYENETHRTWVFEVENFDFSKLVFCYKCYDVNFEAADYNVESHRLKDLKYDGKEVKENIDAYECDNGDFTQIWSSSNAQQATSDEAENSAAALSVSEQFAILAYYIASLDDEVKKEELDMIKMVVQSFDEFDESEVMPRLIQERMGINKYDVDDVLFAVREEHHVTMFQALAMVSVSDFKLTKEKKNILNVLSKAWELRADKCNEFLGGLIEQINEAYPGKLVIE